MTQSKPRPYLLALIAIFAANSLNAQITLNGGGNNIDLKWHPKLLSSSGSEQILGSYDLFDLQPRSFNETASHISGKYAEFYVVAAVDYAVDGAPEAIALSTFINTDSVFTNVDMSFNVDVGSVGTIAHIFTSFSVSTVTPASVSLSYFSPPSGGGVLGISGGQYDFTLDPNKSYRFSYTALQTLGTVSANVLIVFGRDAGASDYALLDSVSAVPEPSTYSCILGCSVLLATVLKRRRE